MKSNHSRAISLLLAIVLTFTLAATALAAAPDDGLEVTWSEATYNADLSDVEPGNWFYDDVMNCAKLGIVAGFEDGTFKPNDNVTYAQYVVMLSRAFYNSNVEKVTDTAGKPWYYPNMKALNDLQLLKNTAITEKGGWPTVLAANDNVTRYDMAQIADSIIVSEGKSASASAINATTSQMKDWAQVQKDVNADKQASVKNCYALGIIAGMSDGTFSGSKTMTRAQACTVMMRMLKLIKNYNPGDADNNQYDDGKTQTPAAQTGAGLTITSTTGAFNGNSNVTSWSIADTGNKTGTLSNGKAITETNIQEIIDVLRKQIPTDTLWTGYADGNNRYNNPGASVNSIMNKYQTSSTNACSGFAAMVSDAIFGKSANPGRLLTDTSKIRTGDIVIKCKTSTGTISHVEVVTKTSGNTHTISDGNSNTKVRWDAFSRDNDMYSHNNSLDNHTYTYYVYTRYPD